MTVIKSILKKNRNNSRRKIRGGVGEYEYRPPITKPSDNFPPLITKPPELPLSLPESPKPEVDLEELQKLEDALEVEENTAKIVKIKKDLMKIALPTIKFIATKFASHRNNIVLISYNSFRGINN